MSQHSPDGGAPASHYFDAAPTAPERRRTVTVPLAGRRVQVQTANGIFSPDGLDKGTAALLSAVPAPPQTGRFLDVGAGWGPLALTLALSSPGAEVTGVEVNQRSLALARDNAAALGAGNVRFLRPEEVTADAEFDLIWSNPPIRIGKEALHGILERWLPALAPGGEAWLVVQKNLGADSLLPWVRTMLEEREPGAFTAERADTVKGFRILKVVRAG
ncbi:class I SAM-dependent methyltransferase [Micrococcus sp.]|uniref:class I SAM-dependent methyltransferase n=1 Tax=Micrococcus sp. TaxID=1271 RepID=UPI002A908D0E|nr:methyltransferase [Micrococcus sp.]MDY6055111.1 methyltransferase [Micrococcus sp.]